PLAANRIQHLQQLRPQQLLRRNRRSAGARVHAVESSRQLGKYFVHHHPDRTQRMIFPHPRFRRQITEHLTLLMIYAPHPSLLTRLACGTGVVFQQPASAQTSPTPMPLPSKEFRCISTSAGVLTAMSISSSLITFWEMTVPRTGEPPSPLLMLMPTR